MSTPLRVGIAAALLAGMVHAHDASTLDLDQLDGVNGFELVKSDALHVAFVGDLNGDGFAEFASGDGDRVYLVFGAPSMATKTVDADALAAGERMIIVSEGNDIIGTAFSSAGDFDNDGFCDLAVAAPERDVSPFSDAGAAYVIRGGTSVFQGTSFSLSNLTPDLGTRIHGSAKADRLGTVVASAGDVGADGIDDLIVCASSGFGLEQGGRVFVWYGTSTPPPVLTIAGMTPERGFEVRGVKQGAKLGESADGAGDVNGDGVADVLLGMPGVSGGQAVVVLGGAGTSAAGPYPVDALTGARGFRIAGSHGGDKAGTAVAGIGDENGDGFDDVLIGAPGSSAYSSMNGRISLFRGSATMGQFGFVFFQQIDGVNGLHLSPPVAGTTIGQALGRAGDLQGDGRADFLVGVSLYDSPLVVNAGNAAIVHGPVVPTSGKTFSLASLDGQNGLNVPGTTMNENIGIKVSGGMDMNGDGTPDFAGAAKDTTYVIFDRAPAPLNSSIDAVSLSAGGEQVLCLSAGAENAGRPWFFLGSMTGTSPATNIQGFDVPVVPDPWFQFLLNAPNPPFFVGQTGILDAAGHGEAVFRVPPGSPTDAGQFKLWHAYVVYEPSTGALTFVSNAAELRLLF